MSSIKIRKLSQSDFRELTQLHKILFDPKHFTSQFSESKLEKYFRFIWQYSQFCYIAYDEDSLKIIGYLFAGENVGRGVKKFYISEFFYLSQLLLRSPEFLIEKLSEVFIRDKKNRTSKANMRLYLIAALSNNEYKGIGKLLINNLEEDLKKSGIRFYGLSVRIHNTNAISFYHHLDFQNEFQSRKSIYLIKNIT